MLLINNNLMEKYSEIIKEIKNGNKDAFNIIYEDHRKMIYKIIYGHKLEKGDYLMDVDSLFQEGSLALYDAVFSYREEKGMSFTAYAYMVIRGRINTYIRDTYKKSEEENTSLENARNIESLISKSAYCISESPVAYHREMEFRRKLSEFVSKLPHEDKEILIMRSEDLSYKQISERLNTNAKHVDNRLTILRKRLKKHLNEYE